MLLIGLFFLLMASILTVMLPAIWRGTHTNINRAWDTAGEAVRGCLRAVVPATCAGWLLGLSAVGDGSSRREVILALCGGVLFFVVTPLLVSIFLQNRPRSLVPPQWRDQPGYSSSGGDRTGSGS